MSEAISTPITPNPMLTPIADIVIPSDMATEIAGFPFAVLDFVHIAPVPPSTEVRRGVVAYIGPTMFADGIWVGIELVGSKGKNDGSVLGVKYFDTKAGQGAFVRPELVTPFGHNVDSLTASIAAAVKGKSKGDSSSERVGNEEPTIPWSEKTLSGKTELELLGDVEKLKDEKLILDTLIKEATEKIEGLELDLELVKEEKLLAEDEIEELKLRLSIAESGGKKGVCDDDDINIMLSIKKSAAVVQAENEKLHRQLEDMKAQISSIDNHSNIMDSITEQNLELTDEVAELKVTVANLKRENEEMKQLQFILDEEMSLQQAQTDEYAAEVERMKVLLSETTTNSSSTTNNVLDKCKNLQEEVSRLQRKLEQDVIQTAREIQSRDRELYYSGNALDHMMYLTRQESDKERECVISSSSLLLRNVDHDELSTIVTDKYKDLERDSGNSTVSKNEVQNIDELKFHLTRASTQSKNIEYNLTEVFNTIVDEQHVLSHITNKAQQCIDVYSQGMTSLCKVISNVAQAKCLRAVNTTPIDRSPIDAMYSSEDLMNFDIATSLLLGYIALRQLSSVFIDPVHHDKLLRYCRENRSAMLASVSSSACRSLIPGLFQSIIDGVPLLVKGATMHAIPGAESYFMSVSHIRSRAEVVASTIKNLYKETLSAIFKGDEVSCISAIHDSCDRYWSNPANDVPNFASACLLMALLESTMKGYDEVMRVLKSPDIVGPILGNLFSDQQNTRDEEGSVNDSNTIMSYFDDSEKLLYKSELSLKKALGGHQSESDTQTDFKIGDVNISSVAVLIKAAGVEAATGLFLLLHSIVVFSSVLGMSERDVVIGVFPTLSEAITSRLSSRGVIARNTSSEVSNPSEVEKRFFWMFTDSIGSLSEISKTTADDDKAVAGGSSSDMPIYWRMGVSPTFAMIHYLNNRDTMFSTMDHVSEGSSTIPVQKLVFLSPLLKTLAGVGSDIKGDDHVTDDLSHCSISTLASLFIHGSVRKDITREISVLSVPSVTNVGCGGKILSPMAVYCRRSLLGALAVDKYQELFLIEDEVNDHNGEETGPRAPSHGAVTEAVAKKDIYIASLEEKIQEMEMRLWEAKSEQNIIGLFQQELETLKRQLDASEKSHQLEMAKQEREFEEAYRKTTAAKALVDRELRMLKTEEKLSPLSAQERHQHNLQIKYYTKLLAQLSFGGLPTLGPIGTSNLISTSASSSTLQKGIKDCAQQQSIMKEEITQRLRRREAEVYFSGLSAVATCHQESINGISSTCFARRSVPFSEVCTYDATRLLMTLHQPSLYKNKCHQSLLKHQRQGLDGNANVENTEVCAKEEDHNKESIGVSKIKVYLPKILPFGNADECKRSRLGVLVS